MIKNLSILGLCGLVILFIGICKTFEVYFNLMNKCEKESKNEKN